MCIGYGLVGFPFGELILAFAAGCLLHTIVGDLLFLLSIMSLNLI